MARRKLSVDREKLRQAVEQAESKGPLKNISALCQKVAEIYNSGDVPEDLNPQVVGLRLKEFNFDLKTKKGRRGRKPGVSPGKEETALRASTPRSTAIARQASEGKQSPAVTNRGGDDEINAFMPSDKPRMPRVEVSDGEDRPNYSRMLVVHTPAGACPVKLKGTNKQDVREWAEAVVQAGYKNNRNYSLDAIKYFVRHFYDMFSEDWKVVVGHLDFWLKESTGQS